MAEEVAEVVEEAVGEEDTLPHNCNNQSLQLQMSKQWANSPKSLGETENRQMTS